MAEQTETLLSDIARVELTHMAELQQVKETCDSLVADARREVEKMLAAVPEQCQQERREFSDRVSATANDEAEAILAQAAVKAKRLSVILESLSSHIVEEVFHMMLPSFGSTPDDQGRAT